MSLTITKYSTFRTYEIQFDFDIVGANGIRPTSANGANAIRPYSASLHRKLL